MNISPDRLLANQGDGLDDRPDYVSSALEADRRVGYRDGKPIVPHPDGADEGLRLGESSGEAYSHYIRGDSLLLPSAGDFVSQLAERVESVSDAAAELNCETETAERAIDLHGVNVGGDRSDPTRGDGADDPDAMELPSGEQVPFAPTHPLVLAQLLSDGLSLEEMVLYLAQESAKGVTESDIREAAEAASLLGDSSDGTSLIPREKRTESADGDYASTPW